jgi:hypothetical protein
MRPLTPNDIESEISYAYLHAVASHAAAGCQVATRAFDGNGIDAHITAWGPFPDGGYIEEVDLHIQLKATTIEPVIKNGQITYFIKGIDRYNDLRKETVSIHSILIVMFLPELLNDWLAIDPNNLLMRKCAYWVSLRGAPESNNETGQTISIPQNQIFDTNNLQNIFATLSRRETLRYLAP